MSSEQGFIGVPGVPDGWELVRVGVPDSEDWLIGYDGNPVAHCMLKRPLNLAKYAIIRKIEQPAKYRAFANAEEFKPHRDRWVRRVLDGLVFRCTSYGGGALVVFGNILPSFSEAFAQFVFDDDGTPFGVRVEE